MKWIWVSLVIFMMGCVNSPVPIAEVEEVDKFHHSVNLNLYRLYYVNFEWDKNVTWDWQSHQKECNIHRIELNIWGLYNTSEGWKHVVLHQTPRGVICQEQGNLNLTSVGANLNISYWDFRWYGATIIHYNITLQ